MIKVTKCLCKQNFGTCVNGTFTKGEIYFVRNSKKGHIVAKSNEGQWVAVELEDNFDVIDKLFFTNRKELRRLSI